MVSQNVFDMVLADLNGRQSRKVANNTYLQKRDENTIALKYHATDVVTYHKDGRIVMDTDGWKTSTTKLRFNESYARLPISRVYSDRGQWYVITNEVQKPEKRAFRCWDCRKKWETEAKLSENTGNLSGEPSEYCPKCGKKVGYASPYLRVEVPFEDGFTLKMNGDGSYHVDMDTIGEDPKRTRKLRRKVQGYAEKFIEALRQGKVGPPSLGDCFYYLMREGTRQQQLAAQFAGESSKTLGELTKDKDHIQSHLAENYFVPSLLVRAMEVMPCSQVMKWAVAEVWQQEKTDEQKTFEKIDSAYGDFVWPELTKMLKRYVLRQLGEVS